MELIAMAIPAIIGSMLSPVIESKKPVAMGMSNTLYPKAHTRF
jgi:hypothetical protein